MYMEMLKTGHNEEIKVKICKEHSIQMILDQQAYKYSTVIM